MATNLDFQEQLNALIAEQNKLLEQTAKITRDQVSLARDMVAALKTANFKDVANSVQDTTKAVNDAAASTEKYGATNQDVFDKVTKSLKDAQKGEEQAGKGMETLGKQVKRFSVAASAIDGFIQGLRMTGNFMHNIVSAGAGLVESLTQIGIAIVSIPFKMLSGLIHMADAGGGSTELQQALEDIRKEFGALRQTSGKAIIDIAKNMKGELSNTGLRVTRIFGNLAERLKTIQEYAHNLGPLFAVLSGQFVENAEAIGAYYKGLGLTEEAQKAVATRSYALGTAVTEELRQIANYSLQLSKAFNGAAGSSKEISRDMGTLMADFKHFGGIATKEIAQSVVYFRRLGIEVAKIMGVIEKYDNFEDAATGAAHLSQAFNLNVDALEMMKAQNPAQRVEMLRKAFFQAGRSVENMTRQERNLLAQQTGLDESALDLAFSMKNQGLSYEQVTKKADAAKKKQLSQAEAMKALADSIERLVRSGSHGSGGFIDRFIQGFTVGIQRSMEFRKIMRSLQIDLRMAFFEGIKVGQAFVKMFPGVKEVFQEIGAMFEPRRFRAMFTKVTQTFKEFFKNMTTDPDTALPKLLENLKKNFFSWFEGNGPHGQKLLNGFKTFFVALAHIAGSTLKIALNSLKDGFVYITDLLAGRSRLSTPDPSGARQLISQLLNPVINAFKEAGPGLWEATKDLFSQLWVKVGPWIKDAFLKSLAFLAAPSLVGMISRTITTSIANAFAGGVYNWAKGGSASKAIESVKNMFSSQIQQANKALAAAPSVGTVAGGSNAVTGVVAGAEQAAQAATQSKVNWGAALVKMGLITVFITVGMAGILYSIYKFAKAMQESRLTPQSVLTASLAMVSAATATVAIAGSVKLLSSINLNAGMLSKIVVGLGIVGVVSAAMAVGANALISNFGDIPLSKISKTVAVMTATGGFFLAAAGIAAIASLVGGIALAGGGLGTVAIAAGLASIAITISLMSVQGLAIMRAIDSFHPSPGFESKAKIFVEVMRGVGSFASSVAQMVSATSPGIIDFIRGVGAKEQQETLKAVNRTIENIGSQLTGIIHTIQRSVTSLSGSEDQLKSAGIITSILGSVGDLAKSMQPPSEALQEPGILAFISDDNVHTRIAQITSHTMRISETLTSFVRMVTTVLTTNLGGGISESTKRAAEVIPSILVGVGQLARSLSPSPATLQELNKGASFSGQLISINRFVSGVLASITGSDLFVSIGQILTNLTTSLRGLSPAQVRTLQAIAPVLGPIMQTISSISNIIGSLAVPTQGPSENNAGAIFNLTQLVNTFFDKIKNTLPAIVTNMRQVFSGIGREEARSFAAGMEGLKSLFGVVADVPNILKALKGASGNGAASITTLEDVNHTLNILTIFLGNPNDPRSFLGITSMLVPQMNTIAMSIGNPRQFMSGLGAIKGMFETFSKIPEFLASAGNIASIGPSITRLATSLSETEFSRVTSIVSGMVAEVNQLASTIHRLEPINIETGLRNLGNSLGLGADGNYTIQNRNFNVIVNFSVKFDQDSLDAFELAMIRRTGPHPTRILHGNLER